MPGESKIGVAFAGAGIVAEMHGRGLAATPAARLVGAYDPEKARAAAITARFGGRVYRSLDDMLADQDVAAVHILAPTEEHVRVALAAMKAGKHVLVEKPVATTVAGIRQLEEASRRYRRVCMPAHNYIYVPSLRRARQLISQGKLGSVASLWVLYNIFHSEEIAAIYGGVLREVCIHHAYSLLYLLGRPARVMAALSRIHYAKLKCEDQASVTCQMPDGSVAHLWCSFAASDPTSDPWTVVFKILGTKGGVSYSWNEAQFEDRGGPAWGLPCYEEGFAHEIDYFVNRCIRHGDAPLSTLSDSEDALRIIEAAERSAATGRVQTVRFSAHRAKPRNR
jgi:predicted dehydrogenase